MDKIMIKGGQRLTGRVTISGAKNSAVALIPASILSDSVVYIDNLPDIKDVVILAEILREMGVIVEYKKGTIMIDPRNMVSRPMLNHKIRELRASYYLMGALLGKFGEAKIGLPGGCNLGARPIDQHIKGFNSLGAEVEHKPDYIEIKADKLIGNKIYLDTVSVGATINIMLAAARAEGMTIIENAAKEPEIVDVATLLNSMGVRITGVGTDVIKIQGEEKLDGCRHSIIPDRIEAGTYMIMAAATAGDVIVDNVIPKHLESLIAKLREIGVEAIELDDSVRIIGQSEYNAVDVKTLPYPGFPTDLQQPFSVLMVKAGGTSVITETIFTSRFRHIDELIRMGAVARVEGRNAIFEGPHKLEGTIVTAMDLRGGAAMVVAALMADGVTEIREVFHIDRGYEDLERKLHALGADIWRVSED